MLGLVDISKAYRDRKVLDGVSFEVADGEFFVLLGPSGGGKTTLLKVICGLESPDRGKVIIRDRDVTKLPPRERNIGMVFQEYGLYPNMNVYENIAYGLEARGVPREEVRRRVEEAAALLQLTPLLHRSITDLSGGEQQRVALARAMAKDADVYLYDEPLSNLDPKLRHQVRRHIQAIHGLKGKPTLYVTHDQTEALALGDRIGIIAEGRLQQVGTPQDLLDNPANTFVAKFVGTPPMNLVRAELQADGESLWARTEGLGVLLPSSLAKSATEYFGGREVLLGFRPDAVSPDGTERAMGTLRGVVTFMEALVGETIAGLRLPNGDEVSVVLPMGYESSLRVGEEATLKVDTDRVVLFDPGSGQSLSVQGEV